MTTDFSTYSRYGAQSLYTLADNPEKIARGLLNELRTEQFEEPDDEHTEVSISREDWAISVTVFGRVTLIDLSWITGSENDHPKNARHMMDNLYMRDVPDDKLIQLMAALVRGEIDRVRSADWRTAAKLPPYVRPYYREPA